MNLDFLDVLSQPKQKHREQAGTAGTGRIHAGLSVPSVVPAIGNSGNKISVPTAGTRTCSHLFPVCSQSLGTERPNVYAAVPAVPGVPNEKQQPCKNSDGDSPAEGDLVEVQVSRWLGARCTRSRLAWGAEEFLYRDYLGWCQKHNQAPGSLEQLAVILDESFQREGNGWQGLCLAVDFAASKPRGRGPTDPLRLATETTQ
jgi:hypothetical protein